MRLPWVELVLLFMLLDGDVDVEIVFKLDDQPGIAGDVQRLG